ncbi:granule-bound starch synthase 1b, chloroplastic/amyloplastic-like [Zingiber officinale]|nr:granule-bound starch synthase 1b, chloroplastic/amyloplastic-like [Zingiber officinale]
MAAAMAFPLTFQGCRSQTAMDSLQMRSINGRPLAPPSWQPKRGPPATKSGPSSVVVCGKGMNIVFVGAEMAPWSKTGGLGDVLGGLPPAMAANGHRVMTIAPRYDQYYDSWDTSVLVDVKVGNRIERVRYFHCYKRGVDRVFVDHPLFLAKVWGQTGGKLYGPTAGTDFEDNQQRFSLFCQAALLAPKVLHLNNSKYHSGPYGEDVIFVANDWHTGPLPCYLKSMYQSQGIYMNAKVAFCIHNIVYQGRFAFSDYEILNLPERFKSSFEFTDGHKNPVKGRKINWMKAGIIECDKAVTVSPYYAQELVSGEERGVELNNILRAKGIGGITNGMDINEWNPSTDKYITAKFDATTAMRAKPVNKEALQAEVGLPVDRNIPLIAFCGRLEEQKGSDIFAAAIPEFINENVQVIVLGTGKGKMERELAQLEAKYPNKVRAHMKFNVPLAHLIMAGADLLAITSRFEPCGLIQFQGMRYGVPSICASTGGLVDTVRDGITGYHMGVFSANCDYVDKDDVRRVVEAVRRALAVYQTPMFARMITNCMNQDLSWKGPAKRWEEFLLGLGASGSEQGFDGEEIAPLAKENVAAPTPRELIRV